MCCLLYVLPAVCPACCMCCLLYVLPAFVLSPEGMAGVLGWGGLKQGKCGYLITTPAWLHVYKLPFMFLPLFLTRLLQSSVLPR